jgi:hypothetical protein
VGLIEPFGLIRGTRVGSYVVEKSLGRGWEAEVFLVREVPTEARRAMRLIRHEKNESVRNWIHRAWFFEQLAETNAVARYYHMGQWFFDDDEGAFYFIFEYLRGPSVKAWMDAKPNRSAADCGGVLVALVKALREIHALGFALGDIGDGLNVIVMGSEQVKACDCRPGRADRPNRDRRTDLVELSELAERLFRPTMKSPTAKSMLRIIREAAKASRVRMDLLHHRLSLELESTAIQGQV